MFRRRDNRLDFLLVHPGGPFFVRKNLGAWSVPKGVAVSGEDFLTRAKIEFQEELGIEANGEHYLSLGSIQQKGGKIVHAWAFEGDLPADFKLQSNTFELEWPPRSGEIQTFPEIDGAEFFNEKVARQKINPAQVPFIDRLKELCSNREHRRCA